MIKKTVKNFVAILCCTFLFLGLFGCSKTFDLEIGTKDNSSIIFDIKNETGINLSSIEFSEISDEQSISNNMLSGGTKWENDKTARIYLSKSNYSTILVEGNDEIFTMHNIDLTNSKNIILKKQDTILYFEYEIDGATKSTLDAEKTWIEQKEEARQKAEAQAKAEEEARQKAEQEKAEAEAQAKAEEEAGQQSNNSGYQNQNNGNNSSSSSGGNNSGNASSGGSVAQSQDSCLDEDLF